MSLLDEHKAERRARILAAARELIAARGFEGLTMRELARSSRVSVPTLYNLFGGKQGLLFAELEETFAHVAASLTRVGGGGLVERAIALCEAANHELLSAPSYTRELVHVFIVSKEALAARRAIHERYVEMMAGVARDAQIAGELVAWVEPVAIAGRIFAHYSHALIEWAQGDLDAESFRAATELGVCLMLLGVARGRAARVLERYAKECQARMGTRRLTSRSARTSRTHTGGAGGASR